MALLHQWLESDEGESIKHKFGVEPVGHLIQI